MSHIVTDQELIEELKLRFERSRKAFADLTTVNLRLREMNRRLEQSERLKSNFLSNIRNEINNPLNAIMGTASQLIPLTRATAGAEELVTTLHDEAFNLDFQLRNIFMAAELEAGDAQPAPVLLNLELLLQELIDGFRTRAAVKRITLAGSVQPVAEATAPIIVTDGEKLALIISNLVANAIEFTDDGGDVTVNLAVLEDGLQLQVTDTGIGILAEDIPTIFDRFRQLDTGATRRHHGHGLGLSIVKALVELLDGRIEVLSQPQAGSSFTVWLPNLQMEPEATAFGVGGNLFLFEPEPDKP